MAATQELLLGEGAGGPAVYIEDVFSTYLYTGTAANLTITNNIDLSTKGGMVWLKVRSGTTGDHEVFDTVRGATNRVIPNATNGQITTANTLTAFNADGFSIGNYSEINGSGNGMASWTFREQPKFFDVVTYTGTGSNQNIAHNLGSVPGCIMIKQTSASGQNWAVYHRSLSGNGYLRLNTTESERSDSNVFPAGGVNASIFTVGADAQVNANGATYVAYLFAHDAGGFGLTGTDNVISCGSFTVSSGNASVTLGYEPQWVLVKNITDTGSWLLFDNMRGMPVGGGDFYLVPNSSNAESSGTTDFINPTATGFNITNLGGSQTFIYIAIRRGPMKVPTDGTSVFEPITTTSTNYAVSTLQQADLGVFKKKSDSTTYPNWLWGDRLRGFTSSSAQLLNSNNTAAEYASTDDTVTSSIYQGGSEIGNSKIYGGGAGSGSAGPTLYAFKRAPSFSDVVCYTGTGSNTTQTHNLGVTPELVIVKARSSANNWQVYNAIGGAGNLLLLNTTQAYQGGTPVLSPTSTTVGFAYNANYLFDCSGSGVNYVAYLFATCAGVSKVGSYTGTGTLTTINCGFVGGARFVLIKRTDAGGAWYIWDTARGMVSGTDPSLMLNSTAVQSNADSIYTITTGFQLLASPAVDVNTNGGSYIYLAIA